MSLRVHWVMKLSATLLSREVRDIGRISLVDGGLDLGRGTTVADFHSRVLPHFERNKRLVL